LAGPAHEVVVLYAECGKGALFAKLPPYFRPAAHKRFKGVYLPHVLHERISRKSLRDVLNYYSNCRVMQSAPLWAYLHDVTQRLESGGATAADGALRLPLFYGRDDTGTWSWGLCRGCVERVIQLPSNT